MPRKRKAKGIRLYLDDLPNSYGEADTVPQKLATLFSTTVREWGDIYASSTLKAVLKREWWMWLSDGSFPIAQGEVRFIKGIPRDCFRNGLGVLYRVVFPTAP